MGKQSQLLLQPTEVELGLQVGVEFDKNIKNYRLKKLMAKMFFDEQMHNFDFLIIHFWRQP